MKAAVHFAMALEDEALQVLANQPLSELPDIKQLVKSCNRVASESMSRK